MQIGQKIAYRWADMCGILDSIAERLRDWYREISDSLKGWLHDGRQESQEETQAEGDRQSQEIASIRHKPRFNQRIHRVCSPGSGYADCVW